MMRRVNMLFDIKFNKIIKKKIDIKKVFCCNNKRLFYVIKLVEFYFNPSKQVLIASKFGKSPALSNTSAY